MTISIEDLKISPKAIKKLIKLELNELNVKHEVIDAMSLAGVLATSYITTIAKHNADKKGHSFVSNDDIMEAYENIMAEEILI